MNRARIAAWLGVVAACCCASDPVRSEEPDDPRPLLRSAWGNPESGAKLNLLGSGFGSHPLQVRSGAGPDTWIETNREGATFDQLVDAPGWDVGPASGAPPVISSERAHSGVHSALTRVDFAADGGWQGVMRYRHSTSFRGIYVSYWIYFDPIEYAPRTQWKQWRINDNGSVSDNCSNIYQFSRWTKEDAVAFQTAPECMLDCPDLGLHACMDEVVPDPYYAPLYDDPFQYMDHHRGGTESLSVNAATPHQWCRFEIFAEASDPDTPNGTYLLAVTKPDQPRKVVDRWTGLVTHRSDCCRDASDPWRWFLFQNYFDDDGGPFQKERADFFLDDIYLQFETQARVELGNQRSYAACTQLEIQTPTSWKDDAIGIVLNHGAFAPGDEAYLFVITADGVASEGLPLQLR